MSMTGNIDRVEVITSVQRRRRWSAEEKARTVQETYAPGMSVALVGAAAWGRARTQCHLASAVCVAQRQGA